MKDTNAKKNWSVLNAAIWGAVVFGGLTSLFALCVKIPFCYPLVYLLPVFNYFPDRVERYFDLDHSALHPFLGYMEGAPFAIIVDTIFGAFVFAVATFLLRLSVGSEHQNGGK